MRGHGVFRDQKSPSFALSLYLYGIDTLERPPSTLMQLLDVKLYGKSGDVPATELGGADTLLGEVKAFDGSNLALGRGRRQRWEAKPCELDHDKLKVSSTGAPQYTVFGRFTFSSSHAGATVEHIEERRVVITYSQASPVVELAVPAPLPGDTITHLAANGTFHAPQGQAIFDVDELQYTGVARGIEVFAAPPGADDLFATGFRIYYQLSPTIYPWHVYGIPGPYDGASTWRFGVRVTTAGTGTQSTTSGTFSNLNGQQGTMTPFEP